MLVYFLKAQKVANQPGMVLYGNPPRWHQFNQDVHTDPSQLAYHAKTTTEIAAAKHLAKHPTKHADPGAHIAAMKEHAGKLQAAASQSAAITLWKQALLAGKAPTGAQAKAMQALAKTNPDKAAALIQTVLDHLGADKAQALMAEAETKAAAAPKLKAEPKPEPKAEEPKPAEDQPHAPADHKDAALAAAIDHLEEDAQQGDIPAKEQKEDAALVAKLKAAKDAPSAAAPKPAAKPKVVVKPKAKAPTPTVAPVTPTVAPTTPVDTVQTAAPPPKHTFTNAKEGMEAYVTPGVGPSKGKWRVTLKDMDSGETLPTVYVVDSEEAAVAKAKKIANLPSTPSTSAPAPTLTVAPAPAPVDTAKTMLQAELSALHLPATNTNAKVVNAKIAKIQALVEAGDYAGLSSEKFGSNSYQKKLAKFAAKAAGALAVAAASPSAAGDDDWEAALFGPDPQAAAAPKQATVNGQLLTYSEGVWESAGNQAYWAGSSQYAAAELLATGTIHPNDLKLMSLTKKAQAVSMVVDQGVDPKKALNKLMTVAADGPFEGDTHTVNGVTYVLHNGRWHRQTTTPEAQVTPAMKDAAIAAAFESHETWADLVDAWKDAVITGVQPTLEQAGVYETMADYDQQEVLGKLVEKQLQGLTPAQFVALSKQASDAGAVHVNAFLADQYLALHAKTLQQGAPAPASVPAITTTINGVEFTKANGVWSATKGGPEFGPGTMPYLAAELYAGLRPDPAVLKQHDPSVLSMVVGELAKDGQDPVKLLNAVFPQGGADGAYGNGAVFTMGLQDFVLHNGKWQEQTQAAAPALDANLPGPSGNPWYGGSDDTPDLAGWFAAMIDGKTPNKAQQQAATKFIAENPKDGVAMKTAIWNLIGQEQYKLQLKPHSPHQYSQADQVDILQDWVHAIAYGKQPTAKMALIYDSLNDQAKQNWAEQALMEMVGDPDDNFEMQTAKDKLQRLQQAALGMPVAPAATAPNAPTVQPTLKDKLTLDQMEYVKDQDGDWVNASLNLYVSSFSAKHAVLEVMSGKKLTTDELNAIFVKPEIVAQLTDNGFKPEDALQALFPPGTQDNAPQEGDTKSVNGIKYQLLNGRWHRVIPAAGSGTHYAGMAEHIKKLSKLGYTNALISGKVPTKAQHQAYLQALTAASDANVDMQLLIDSHNNLIDTAIGEDAHKDLKLQMHTDLQGGAAPATPAPTVVLTQPITTQPDDTESWAFDSFTQKGSNLGGLYTDKSGQQWYVKVPKSAEHARNELLAAKLYEAAGVAVPTLKLVKSNGQVAIASQWVEGMQKVGAGIKGASGALEGFAVDAWLANYDSVGTGYDNLLKDAQGKAVRIDVGGALLFRAQGAPKTDFGNQVTELQSMLDPAKNSYTAAVFGGISDDQIKAGVAQVAAITPDQIKQMVQQYGPGTAAEKAALADKLIARREDLLKKHPVAAAKPAVAATTAADTSWHQEIKDKLDALLPAPNNVKYKTTLAKVEKFKKLLDAQDYAAIASTVWGKNSYGFQVQRVANKVNKQVAATQPPAPAPSAPPFDPSKLGTPPDFMNWGGSGKPGPSAVLAVNQANQDATQDIYAAAQTGDVAAVTAVQGKVVDKATGQVTGTTPVLQHPSQHISSFAQQMINEIEDQKVVKQAFVWQQGQSALAAIDQMSAVVKDFATKTVKKIGYFIEVSKPGVVGKVSDLITAAKITWKAGQVTEQTYAKEAQAAYVKIPKAQLQALQSYTGNKYHEINKSLWEGNPVGAAKSAEKALHTYGHPVKEGTILSRKFSLHGSDLQDFLKSAGSCLQEPAVMSTSLSPDVWSGNIHLKLHVGPGVKGLYVGYGSTPGGGAISVNAGEKELLLPPNTRLYVVSVKQVSDPDADGFGGHGMKYLAECVVLPTTPL